jgi:antitoxin YefM
MTGEHMPNILPSDVRPLTEFRANIARYIDELERRERPLILTQHGHSAAVLLGVAQYEKLIEELELVRDVRAGEEELVAGEAIPARPARAEVLRRLER